MDPVVDGWCSNPLTWFREHQLAEFDKNTVVFTGSPSISRHGPKDVVWTCVNPKTWGAHLKPMDIRTPFLGWSSRHIPSCWRRPKNTKLAGFIYFYLVSCIPIFCWEYPAVSSLVVSVPRWNVLLDAVRLLPVTLRLNLDLWKHDS